MRSGHSVSRVAAAILILSAVSCAGVKQGGTGVDGGGNGSGGPGSGGSIGSDARPEIGGIEVGNPSLCGNGVIDPGEQCDDGNKTPGDGCSAICQIPAGWTCTGTPSVCSMAGVCGDGILGATEACDDGNTVSGDGCSSDCKTVDPGYECRVPGRPCVPTCGDGMIVGMEQCDDGNTTDGDGCSSTCQVEPGATCPKTSTGAPAPGKCMGTVCGNGVKEGNEGCDCGTDPANLPSGCKGPNGLFFGDASGCSKTCTKEPTCRDSSGKNQACSTSCGNGAVETGEQCDDGNTNAGDGCSPTCTLEGGFMCSNVMQDDAVDCMQAGNSGKCLELPIIYRDFKNESVTGGHPDFFYLGANPIANPVAVTGATNQAAGFMFNKRYCVPNSSGPAKKNDATNRCWDLAQANLGPTGKPVFNMSRTGAGGNPLFCDCQFIDWSHNGNGGHLAGYGDAGTGTHPLAGLTYTQGETMGGSPMYHGPAPVVSSAANFATWWVDGTYTGNTHTVGLLEMHSIGGTPMQYQYSSQINSVTGGFFPLDPVAHGYPLYMMAPAGPGTPPNMVGTEPMLCNLWPYWFQSSTFGAGNGCKGDQYLFPPSLIPPDTATGCPTGMNCGGKWYTNQQGWYHDSWFSDEARYLFTYDGDFTLQFYGDDDMYIFINGILVIDLGGVHQRLPGKVSVTGATGMATITEGGSLDATGTNILTCPSADPYTGLTMNATTNTDGNGHSNCTITNCDCRTRTVNLNLSMGRTFEIAVFGADRHPTESNYQLTLSGFQTQKSNCMPRCGDGVRTGAEECDCGDANAPTPTDPLCGGMKNNDTLYGGCTTMCKYGPYCGDGIVQSPQEECDNGSRNNNVTYGNMNGCAPGCKYPHFCGDGIVDESEGEQCDLGTNNGMTGAPCTTDCKVRIDTGM
jgi:fibro-slime domain-containing protein